MRLYKLFSGVLLIALCAAVCSCTKGRKFTVEGQLEGKAPEKVSLERNDPQAGWIMVQEVHPGDDGSFSLSYEAPDYPQLFRIGCGGKYVYLPVDSTENFALKANSADISRGFTLSGSPQAQAMTTFEAEASRIEACDNPDSVESFKRRVFNNYLKEAKANIFSYYVLTRKMGDGYLIDYTDPLYAAVATSFKTYKPDDPHTQLLAEQAIKGRREVNRRKGKQQVVKAHQSAMIEVELPDIDDRKVRLSSLLGKGKPVVLAFGGLTIPDATAINMQLRKIYDAGQADIYQVCLDSDRFVWAQGAKGLPWTVVFDPEGLRSTAAMRYNLASVPAYFVYNRSGELVSSTGSVTELPSLLSNL